MGRQQFPRGFPPQLLPLLMKNAVDALIMQKAVVAEADRMGLKVSERRIDRTNCSTVRSLRNSFRMATSSEKRPTRVSCRPSSSWAFLNLRNS